MNPGDPPLSAPDMASMNDSEAAGPWSCCLTVPSSTAACIEVPGSVGHSSQGVVTALGGQQDLGRAIRDSDNLQLQLRPGDPQAHPLIAEPEVAQGLILKLSRPRAASNGGAAGPGGQQVCSVGWADVASGCSHLFWKHVLDILCHISGRLLQLILCSQSLHTSPAE